MKISPLIRRVSIYLILSSLAVVSGNLVGIDQQGSYKIYIPMFIAIYIISRWIDSKIDTPNTIQTISEENKVKSNAQGFTNK